MDTKINIKGKTLYANIEGIDREIIYIDLERGVVFVYTDYSDDGDGGDLREEVFDMDKVEYITAV